MPQARTAHPSSYRDPSGFIFTENGTIYRQVNLSYKKHFDHFTGSGCYKELTELQWLIPHDIAGQDHLDPPAYITIRPLPIPFISYPYEWSFDMLRDAALLTLGIQRKVTSYGMTLKDATPYNIQWYKGKMIFIDSLSFEISENSPWVAYRQFCEQFLAPLLLMHYTGSSLHQLLLAWPEGVPLHEARQLLPYRSRWSFHTWLHIHLHAKISSKAAGKARKETPFSRQKMNNLVTSLELLIRKLKAPGRSSGWKDYYEEAGARDNYLEPKKLLVKNWLQQLKGIRYAADLGANQGEFAGLLAAAGLQVIAADSDPGCINTLYLQLKKSGEESIQPLIIDLANPSPAIGLNNQERSSFPERMQPDLVIALAIVHHLAIGRNIPFSEIARLFSMARQFLIIEFVPKDDAKVQQLLMNRTDLFSQYTLHHFITAFEAYFEVLQHEPIGSSQRTLLLMQRKGL